MAWAGGRSVSELSELYKEIAACQDCELCRQRQQAVPGEGAADADILFIGEAPGWHEDQQGRPFVGPAGHFLDELLRSIDLSRGDVYIANVIKCRPPANRDPLPTEIAACRKWLDRQIELIGPKVIVTLGRYSLAQFFPGDAMGKARGNPRKKDGMIYFPMYHPAAALHQGSLRKVIMEDMLKIPQLLAEKVEVKAEEQQPEQLSMF
jgi:uracil-DNA glycosylase family 4